jgi:hypothetical protein
VKKKTGQRIRPAGALLLSMPEAAGPASIIWKASSITPSFGLMGQFLRRLAMIVTPGCCWTWASFPSTYQRTGFFYR